MAESCNEVCDKQHYNKVSFAADNQAMVSMLEQGRHGDGSEGFFVQSTDQRMLRDGKYGNNVWDFSNATVRDIWIDSKMHDHQLMGSTLNGAFIDEMWSVADYGADLIQWASTEQYTAWLAGRNLMLANLTRQVAQSNSILAVNYLDLHNDNDEQHMASIFDALSYVPGAQVLYHEPQQVMAGIKISLEARKRKLGTMFMYRCGDPKGINCISALAAFLCGADSRSYFSGPTFGNDGQLQLLQSTWWDTFDKPLGVPLGDCTPIPNVTDPTGAPIYRRQFASGTTVTFDPNTYGR